MRSSIRPARWDPEHLRTVVVAVADERRRPGRPAGRRSDAKPLVGVDGGRRQRDVGPRVGHQPAEEGVGELGEPQAAGVLCGVALEHVHSVAPEADVEVAAVAGQVREGLGHERRDQSALLGERLDHVAEEDGAVARAQRVGEREVLLELPVGVLVVGRVVVPAEPRDRLGDLHHEVQAPRQGAHVVAGLTQRVELVGELERPVGAASQQEVLELRADLQLVAELRRACDGGPQDRARAVRPGLALDGDVACESRDVRPPGEDRQARRIGDRDYVGIVRSLTDVPRREAREARAVVEQVVEVVRRHELRIGLAVHVDELGEQELDATVLDDPPHVVGVLWGGGHRVEVYPSPGGRAMAVASSRRPVACSLSTYVQCHRAQRAPR